jgi:hypothetical protein
MTGDIPETEPEVEPGEPGQHDSEPPEKIEFAGVMYGYLICLHGAIEVALDELALYVSEDRRQSTVDRARARLSAVQPEGLRTDVSEGPK